jgi:AraC-like DNA-binding protein
MNGNMPGSRFERSAVTHVFHKTLATIFFSNWSIKEKINSVESTILKSLSGHSNIETVVPDLISQIHLSQGCKTLHHLYRRYRVSARQLQNHFKQHTGMTIKSFSKIIRLDNVRKMKSAKNRISLTELCYEFGYCDQSHMIKDFKQITGLTPSLYLKKRADVRYTFHS